MVMCVGCSSGLSSALGGMVVVDGWNQGVVAQTGEVEGGCMGLLYDLLSMLNDCIVSSMSERGIVVGERLVRF